MLLLAMLRIVNSPFGRVLQAIRENEFRAEAIGYRVVVYRTTSSILSALFATLAGAMLAIWLRYNGPDTSLSFEIMLDVLLIVVIGGMGTIYGAAIGSGVFVVAQSYLQDLLQARPAMPPSGLPWLSALLSPDRWLLWLGLLFVLSVYYFPTGIVGRLRALRRLTLSLPPPTQETYSEDNQEVSARCPATGRSWARRAAHAALLGIPLLLAACGGGTDSDPLVRKTHLGEVRGAARGRRLLLEGHPLRQAADRGTALAGAAGAAGMDDRPRHHVLRQRLLAVRPHLRPGRQQQVRRNHRHHAQHGGGQRGLPVPERLAAAEPTRPTCR